MNRLIGIVSVLVASVAVTASAGSRRNMEQFLWGVYALQECHGLTDAQKAAYFQSLSAITGVTVQRARHFVNQYRNRPDDWQKVLDAIGKVPSTVEPNAPPPPPAPYIVP